MDEDMITKIKAMNEEMSSSSSLERTVAKQHRRHDAQGPPKSNQRKDVGHNLVGSYILGVGEVVVAGKAWRQHSCKSNRIDNQLPTHAELHFYN